MTDSGYILAMETAVSNGSVALLRGGTAIGGSTDDVARAENLLSRVDSLLRQQAASVADIGTIAVALGPGSYTGIRIGIATSLGLARACGIRIVGASCLEAMAWSSNLPKITAALPFGRNSVAIQIFEKKNNYHATEPPKSVNDAAFPSIAVEQSALVTHPVLAQRFRLGGPNIIVCDENIAAMIGAYIHAGNGTEQLSPIYLEHAYHERL